MPNVQTHPHRQNGGNRQKFQCDLWPLDVAVLSMFTCCFLNEDVTNKLVSELDFTICQPGFFAVSLPYMEQTHLISFCFWIFPVAQNCPHPKSLTLTLPSNYLTHRWLDLCQEPGSNFAVSFLRVLRARSGSLASLP